MRRDGRMSTNVQFLGKEVPVEVSDSNSEDTDKKLNKIFLIYKEIRRDRL